MPEEDIDIEELGALVLGFLQQTIGEYREGLSLRDFERLFPERCDESRDWYRRYGVNSTIEALEKVPNVARIYPFQGNYRIILNKESADDHLFELITKQRSKKPKRKPPVSPWHNLYAARKNYPSYSTSSYRSSGSSAYRAYHPSSSSRFRQHVESSRTPAPTSSSFNCPRSSQSSSPASSQPSNHSCSVSKESSGQKLAWNGKPLPPSPPTSSAQVHAPSQIPAPAQVLTPTQVPTLAPLQVSADSMSFNVLSAPHKYSPDDQMGVLKDMVEVRKSQQPLSKESIPQEKTQHGREKGDLPLSLLKKLQDLRLRSLAPSARQATGEKKARVLEIEDEVKWRTLRLVVLRPLSKNLKVSQWQEAYEKHTNLHIKVSAYGFRTVEEFFRNLEKDLPICLKENEDRELTVEIKSESDFRVWLSEKMAQRQFGAMISLNSIFELIATPNDHYKWRVIPHPFNTMFDAVKIRCIKEPSRMWLHMTKFDDDLLRIQSSMCAYRDYRQERILPNIPKYYLTKGYPCAAFDKPTHQGEQRWCRAIVTSVSEATNISESKVTCLLVDYGVTRTYVAEQLSCILKVHMSPVVIPFWASLYGVEPIDATKGWSRRASGLLSEYIHTPVDLACKIEGAMAQRLEDEIYLPETCYEVTLCDVRNTEDKYLSQWLISAELARPSPGFIRVSPTNEQSNSPSDMNSIPMTPIHAA